MPSRAVSPDPGRREVSDGEAGGGGSEAGRRGPGLTLRRGRPSGRRHEPPGRSRVRSPGGMHACCPGGSLERELPTLSLLVQKFGGTSVADSDKILAAARRAIRAHQRGEQVLVVVSARGHTTDELIALAKEINERPAGPRDGHAPLDRRAGQRRPDGDGDPGPGRPRDQLHRGPDRHRHRQLPHQGPDPQHLDRADGPGARRGQDRHRRRLPGGRRELQHHHPRPGRLRHDGRGPGRRARGRRLRDLHRRRRRLHDRPPGRPRGPQDRPDQLRRDARAGQPGGGRDALAVDRVRQEVRRADPRPQLVLRRRGDLDRRRGRRPPARRHASPARPWRRTRRGSRSSASPTGPGVVHAIFRRDRRGEHRRRHDRPERRDRRARPRSASPSPRTTWPRPSRAAEAAARADRRRRGHARRRGRQGLGRRPGDADAHRRRHARCSRPWPRPASTSR